jgi:mRNA interferase MazF
MPLNFHPALGEIVLCDYSGGFALPEMVKRRPVVIISPRLRRRDNLATVVPLSTTPPDPAEPHHCRIVLAVRLPPPFDAPEMWAKCDMLCTVSLARLDRFRDGRAAGGNARRFRTGKVSAAQLVEIRCATLNALGLSSLTIHL